MNPSNRFERQRDFIPQERLGNKDVCVIGVGAIGRQVALQLASIGVRHLQLIDFDSVDSTNVTTQGYLRQDVGQQKVDATTRAIRAIDPEIAVEGIVDRFRPRHLRADVIFCCVDSIDSRAAIWRSVENRSQFWADGRMLGEVIRVLIAVDDAGRRQYPRTLFASNEAYSGRCTAHSTIYTANIAAGLLVHQFARWLRGAAPTTDSTISLLSGEWIPGSTE